MSKKFDNFLTKHKKHVRVACYIWVILILLSAIGTCLYFLYTDWSAVQFTQNVGLTPPQYMTMIGAIMTGTLTVYMLVPAWAILSKLKKLSV